MKFPVTFGLVFPVVCAEKPKAGLDTPLSSVPPVKVRPVVSSYLQVLLVLTAL